MIVVARDVAVPRMKMSSPEGQHVGRGYGELQACEWRSTRNTTRGQPKGGGGHKDTNAMPEKYETGEIIANTQRDMVAVCGV